MTETVTPAQKKSSFFKIKIITLFTIGIGLSQQANADIIVPKDDAPRTIMEIRATRLLTRATMGYTPAEISAFTDRLMVLGQSAGYSEWIDQQMALPVGSLYDHTEAMLTAAGLPVTAWFKNYSILKSRVQNMQHTAWWDYTLNAEDQLRQRVTWALIQIFVTSGIADENALRYREMHTYYDILQENAFGSYRQLLQDITYNTKMGFYLSSVKNPAGNEAENIFPDENFAREILQLFSMGVNSLNNDGTYQLDTNGSPIENYTNADITNLAKVFTGLNYPTASGGVPDNFFSSSVVAHSEFPMVMDERYHDQTEKNFLGLTIPAGGSGDDDITAALDHIASHPSVAPYMSRALITRLVSSNPSNAYVNRVANVWTSSNGNLGSVVKAILTDTEAASSLRIRSKKSGSENTRIIVTSRDNLNGRLKEPVLMFTQFFRYFGIDASQQPGGYFIVNGMSAYTSMRVLNAPSVFNYYNSDYIPGNGPAGMHVATTGEEFFSPEAELLPTSMSRTWTGFTVFSNANRKVPQTMYSSAVPAATIPGLIALADTQTPMTDLVNMVNRDLALGTMSISMQADLVDLMENSGESYDTMFEQMMTFLFTSSPFAISL